METTVINATEYRELPLALLNESKTNPRRVFDDVAFEGTRRQHPQPGRSLALACPATHRKRLRDRRRSAALPRRADGRSRHRARPHQADDRCRSIGGATCREPDSRRDSPDGRGRRASRALLALEEPKYSIEQIAAKVGKSPVFVASRLKLIDLVPAAVDAFYANEIGVGHALLLAKLPADQQEQALSACFKEVYNGGASNTCAYSAARAQSAILD